MSGIAIKSNLTTEEYKRLEKELVKMKYINTQMTLSQKKREEMIAYIIEENKKLRAENEAQQKDIQKKDNQFKLLQKKLDDELRERDDLWTRFKLLQTQRQIDLTAYNSGNNPESQLGSPKT